ncbi:hypothetical protein F4860DRAFT_516049 [Xylaria cubensis]|nr:hypothetical protein F4860DRAFT_516049 [Xylaria cubensis]
MALSGILSTLTLGPNHSLQEKKEPGGNDEVLNGDSDDNLGNDDPSNCDGLDSVSDHPDDIDNPDDLDDPNDYSYINGSDEEDAEEDAAEDNKVNNPAFKLAVDKITEALITFATQLNNGQGNSKRSSSLLDFQADITGHKQSKHRAKTPHQRWRPEDRQRLKDMKEKGWPNDRIAMALGRSAGAVAQQWRKQVKE